MVRISNVDLLREKRVEIGLTYIHGIDRANSNRTSAVVGVNPNARVKSLTGDEVKKLVSTTTEIQTVGGDPCRKIAINIERLQEVGYYRRIRHRKGLSACGQKTEANVRTCRGPRKIAANRKK